jgi:outer membrane receptor for ferrienterochelin and colicins
MSRFSPLAAALGAATPMGLCLITHAAYANFGDDDPSAVPEIVVTARHLDDGRATIQTATGASTYTFNSTSLAAIPGGDNVLLNQVILRAPDVVQDSFGQFHIRGEHNGLQYRLNGIILPEGISVFGQSLDPRFVSTLSLITGALPAEYGLRTGGIIDITTKSGIETPGGAVTLYGGSHGTIQPSLTYGGGSGSFSYVVTGDFLSSDLGIESPDGSSNPVHDHTQQYHGFGYFENILSDESRVAVMLGISEGQFQIPNIVGAQPSLGLTVNRISDFASEDLDENQREVTRFGAVSWQYSQGALNMQTSLIARYSSLAFVPDFPGDLLFTGIAQDAYKQNVAYAGQSDGSYRLSDNHTLRAGLFIQSDHSISNTESQVLLTDAMGVSLSDAPSIIVENGAKTEWIYSAYLQDEWKALPDVTVNYGLRFDRFSAFTDGTQTSPRLNMVWQAHPDTTVHLGYSRYFSPPPFELVGSKDISLFENTTSPPLTPLADVPQAERANYYDIGVQQNFTRSLTVGIDTYYKQSVDLIDEGQFGAPIILTPFNYRYGKQYGAELTAEYTTREFLAYLNLAAQSAQGKLINSAQFNFTPEDLAYIARHYIHLDHEQQITGSAGLSYLWHDTRFSMDILLGSGLRADLLLPPGQTTDFGGDGIPNGMHQPRYTQVNTGVSHVFAISGAGTLTARCDIINLFDNVYQIRNGTGVGVGAPQFGPRRGFFLGLSKSI